MPTYKGIEFKTIAKPVDSTDSFHAQFTITEHRGNETIDHMARYVTISGTDERAVFASESEAKEAAQQVAINKIEAM